MTGKSICSNCKNLEREYTISSPLVGTSTCYACQLGVDTASEVSKCVDYEKGEPIRSERRVKDTTDSSTPGNITFELWGAIRCAYNTNHHIHEIRALYEACKSAMLRSGLLEEEE